MTLVRLIYASRFSQGAGPNDIQDILNESRAGNSKRGITGVLCYDPKFFLQCLEGPRDQVNALYRAIVGDTRHGDVTLLEYSDIDERAFPKWSMAYVRADRLTESIILGYSASHEFDPFALTAKQALGLTLRISEERERFLEEVEKG